MKAYNGSLYKTDIGFFQKAEGRKNEFFRKFFLFDYFDFLEIDDSSEANPLGDLEDWILGRESVLKSLETSLLNNFDFERFSAKQKVYMCSFEGDNVAISSDEGTPYILLLQLSFNEVFYKAFKENELRDTISNTVIPKIKNLVKSVYDRYSSESYSINVFHLISSGDLAVVLQANSMKLFPEIQQAISLMSINLPNSGDLETVLFTLYSIMGVDVKHDIVPSDFNPKDKISIRCSFSEEFKEKLLNNEVSISVNDSFNLIGSYDITFNMNPNEFVNLYNSIRTVKLEGPSNDSKHHKANDISSFIEDGSFSTINERVFFHNVDNELINQLIINNELLINPTSTSYKGSNIRQHLCKKIISIRENIHLIYNEANKIWKDAKIPSEIENAAYEYNRILTQVISSISSKTKQDFDAIISVDLIELLTSSTKEYLLLYANDKIDENCLVSSINDSISMIGRYVNQMYAINLNNYESPVFFSSLPSASEKLIVAYTQFLMTYVDDVVSQIEKTSKKTGYRRLVPLIEPDITEFNPGLQLFFSELDYPRLNIVNIKSPSNHKLAHTIEQLKAFSHEVGHYFPYENRKERNLAYLLVVLTILAEVLFLGIFPEETSENISYHPYKEFFVKEFINYFYEKLSKESGVENKVLEFDFASFCEKIEEYFICTFSTIKDDPIKMLKEWLQEAVLFSKKSRYLKDVEKYLLSNKTRIKTYEDSLKEDDRNPLAFLSEFKEENYKDCKDIIFEINKNFSIKVDVAIKEILFSALDKVGLECVKIKNVDKVIKDCKVIGENAFESCNLDAFNEYICQIADDLSKLTLDEKIDKKSYYQIKKCINLDLEEIKIIYSDRCALVNRLYIMVTQLLTLSNKSIVTNHLYAKHCTEFFEEFYDSFSLFLYKNTVKKNGNSFYSSFHKIGFYFQNDPQSGKDYFGKMVEEKIQMLSVTTYLEDHFVMAETLFKETLADVIMILTCEMGVKDYKEHSESYLAYVDSMEGVKYQFIARNELACIISSKLANNEKLSLSINEEWKSQEEFDGECLNAVLGDSQHRIVEAMCSAIIPTIICCDTVTRKSNYSTMKNLFVEDKGNPPMEKEVEFLFDWFYNNRWHIANHHTFLIPEENS